jgi:hypothetical protein
MEKRIFHDDIKKMTLTDLKEMAMNNKWDMTGAKLKADFQRLILRASYRDAQMTGIAKLGLVIEGLQ